MPSGGGVHSIGNLHDYRRQASILGAARWRTAQEQAMAIPRARRAAVAAMLAIAPVSSSLTAQDIGDRVRVSSIGGVTTIGEVADVSDDGFELVGQGRRQSFTYGQIYRLERSAGARRLWKRGLAYGAATGVTVGLAMGLMAEAACDLLPWVTVDVGQCHERWPLEVALLAGLHLGVRAGGLGMAVGALIRRESWMPIPIRGRRFMFSPLVGPVPGRRGGVMLGGRLGL